MRHGPGAGLPELKSVDARTISSPQCPFGLRSALDRIAASLGGMGQLFHVVVRTPCRVQGAPETRSARSPMHPIKSHTHVVLNVIVHWRALWGARLGADSSSPCNMIQLGFGQSRFRVVGGKGVCVDGKGRPRAGGLSRANTCLYPPMVEPCPPRQAPEVGPAGQDQTSRSLGRWLGCRPHSRSRMLPTRKAPERKPRQQSRTGDVAFS